MTRLHGAAVINAARFPPSRNRNRCFGNFVAPTGLPMGAPSRKKKNAKAQPGGGGGGGVWGGGGGGGGAPT